MISGIYGAITNFRNALYEKEIFKSVSLGVPTFSVGNITVGGTGKTPLVALIAEMLAGEGARVCVLTRGYGRENAKTRAVVSDGEQILIDAKQAGDEPSELARRLLGKAVVIADANRVAAGKWARETFQTTVFVLDDAFQHRRARRDLDIVLIDATNPFGNGKTLPFGILREPLANLKRADAIVVSRANLAENISDLRLEISKYNSRCPIFVTKNRISRLIRLEDFQPKALKNEESRTPRNAESAKSQRQLKAFAFCALGNPNNFFAQLKQENFNVAAARKFPDHHFYTLRDIESITNKAVECGAKILLTTAKDAIKLTNLKIELPCFVAESEMIFDDEIKFREMLLKVKMWKSENVEK